MSRADLDEVPSDDRPLWDRRRAVLEDWLDSDDPVRRTLAEVHRELAEDRR